MLPSKLGWNTAFVSDEVIRGYMGELQDFVEAVAYDREPASGSDLPQGPNHVWRLPVRRRGTGH